MIVQAGRNTAINVSFELASVEETITVTGQSPMVDTKSTVIGTSFDSQMLQDIPSARDVWSLPRTGRTSCSGHAVVRAQPDAEPMPMSAATHRVGPNVRFRPTLGSRAGRSSRCER